MIVPVLNAILAAFGGPNRATVGPAGLPVTAGWILKPDGVAVVESAEACGRWHRT